VLQYNCDRESLKVQKVGNMTDNKDDMIRLRTTKTFKEQVTKLAKKRGFSNSSEFLRYLLRRELELEEKKDK